MLKDSTKDFFKFDAEFIIPVRLKRVVPIKLLPGNAYLR